MRIRANVVRSRWWRERMCRESNCVRAWGDAAGARGGGGVDGAEVEFGGGVHKFIFLFIVIFFR